MRILGGTLTWIGIAVMLASASASVAGATFGAVATGGVVGLGLLIVGKKVIAFVITPEERRNSQWQRK